MNHIAILKPFVAQVFLTILVWIWMYITRISSMMRNRVKTQELATDSGFAKIKDAENPSDNLINLFEIPILFYLLIVVLIQTEQVDDGYLMGAWVFVICRTIHSIVHCSFNHVMTRFLFYLIASLTLFAMWIRFGLKLFG